MDPTEEIKKLYFNATRGTILKDIARAVSLIKQLPDDEARDRVAVYMDGLSQMRAEWNVRGALPVGRPQPGGTRGSERPKPARPAASTSQAPRHDGKGRRRKSSTR